MKGINTTGKIITKILEVFHWVGAALMTAATVCSAVAPDWVKYFVRFDATDCCGVNLSVYGFEVNAPVVNGAVDLKAFMLFGIGSVVILLLMAMVFRNLYLIFKASDNATPFQEDNIRRFREIGIFSIAMPIVGLVMSIIIRLILGVDNAEISTNFSGIFMGIIVLCLTRFFIHGAKLEEDVDGLV